jgi:septum formation protein
VTLVLASTSRYRRASFERLGVPFVAVAPDCDEDAYKGRGLTPRALAELLARKKADSVHAARRGDVIVGGDQVVALGDAVLDKPGSAANAEGQLARLSGQRFALYTAIAVLAGDRVALHTDVTHLTMRALDEDAIRRYVAADEPLDSAGSFRIEARGITLFSAVETADPSAIEGVPLLALTRMLVDLGFRVP